MSNDLTETRTVDPETGGEKGTKLPQLGAIDPLAILALSKIAGFGANKYSHFNYLKGTKWSLMFDAMMRHALLFWQGYENDGDELPEGHPDKERASGLPHMAHAAWMALALVSFSERGLGADNRYVQPVDLHEVFEEAMKTPIVDILENQHKRERPPMILTQG
jgi:hypothetical protein